MQLDYALRQVRIRDILISEKGKIPRGSVSFGKNRSQGFHLRVKHAIRTTPVADASAGVHFARMDDHDVACGYDFGRRTAAERQGTG
jgi:hypothetical protein